MQANRRLMHAHNLRVQSHWQPAAVLSRWHSVSRVCSVPTSADRWKEQQRSQLRVACASTSDAPKAPTAQEIAERIAASRERKSKRIFIKCPACSIGVASPANIYQHMAACCPDLLVEPAWQQLMTLVPGGPKAAVPPGFEPLASLLAAASKAEAKARDEVLHWTFRSGELDEQGQLVRHSVSTVASRMNLPPSRVSRLLGAALRGVPLVADPDPIDILHECEHFLAVNKPPHVQTAPVHRYKGGSMVNRVLNYLGCKAPHVVHRLDMNTSGVLLFAKTSAVVSSVHKQFRHRKVKKLYTCVTMGTPQQQSWDEYGLIGPHPRVGVARSVQHSSHVPLISPGTPQTRPSSLLSQPQHPAASSESDSDQDEGSDSSRAVQDWQEAHTSFLQLRTNPGVSLLGAMPGDVYTGPDLASGVSGCSLVAAAPHSGRTHQIRVHVAAAGIPLLGDELYGLKGPWIGRQALHASRLSITHPLTGQPLTFKAPLPQDMLTLAQSLGLVNPRELDVEHVVDQAWEQLTA